MYPRDIQKSEKSEKSEKCEKRGKVKNMKKSFTRKVP